LPDPIFEAVGYHKNLGKGILNSLSPLDCVHIANVLDEECITGTGSEKFQKGYLSK
jgi:hypothetical protein